MYSNVRIINKDEHRNLRFRLPENLDFTSKIAHAPLVAGEFFAACKSQPILFIKNDGHIMPCVLLGLKDGQNLFLDAKKQWRKTEYCPFIFKRYPFVYVNLNGKLTLAYDTDCRTASETEGEAVFDENGVKTKFVDSVLDKMNRYHSDSLATGDFCKKLDELGLLSDFSADISSGGQKHRLDGFLSIDEKKFEALSDEAKSELIRLRYYNYIVAHFISMSGLDKLALFAAEMRN